LRFSDTFLRQVRDRVSIAEYAGKRMSWNARKTRAAAGDYWACCPFHQEKSASFHVLDQKGIFNCFGCGEKGDVFGLAMKLEGLSFPEAVERQPNTPAWNCRKRATRIAAKAIAANGW
jgi:DNA primase